MSGARLLAVLGLSRGGNSGKRGAGGRMRQSIASATLIALLAVAGCRASDTSQAVVETPSSGTSTPKGDTPSPTPTPTPTASPTSTPISIVNPAASVVEAMASQLASIASNFNVSDLLRPSWGTGRIAIDGNDVVGAFRFICSSGHLAKDDPVVYPNQPGRSHLHQFFGNTLTDANSTYASLRSTGESTCGNKINRSAYWIPAMMNGKGKVVKPDYLAVYYKRYADTDAECTRTGKACVPLPRGLRYVFGYNMSNPADPMHDPLPFTCDGPTALPGYYADIVSAAAKCPIGNRLGVVLHAPSCWDGKRLDSADHRSHVGYAVLGDGGLKCPDTLPYLIPQFTLTVWYSVDADLDRSGVWDGSKPTWYLASDQMTGMPLMRPGTTIHADWFGAWDDGAMKTWTDNCINKLLSCTGGDLGNGTQIIGADAPAGGWEQGSQLVDPPG